MAARPRVLVITFSPVAEEMGGPAIRALELARALAPHADVTLAAREGDRSPPALGVELVTYRYRDPRRLRPLIEAADAIVSPPPPALLSGWMRRSGARLVFDLYNPEPFEALEHHHEAPSRWRRLELDFTLDRYLTALHIGHHFAVASERQRDLWLGAMMARRLLTPDAYADPTLRSVLDVVPFGLPADPPPPSGRNPIEALPGVGPGDEVALWNGGIWPWLDAPVAVEAAALIAQRRPGVRLVFMGASPSEAGRRAAEEARERARALGVAGSAVIFNDRWVPYEERAAWLLAADVAVATHRDHLETRFAFRTRLLDCLWARLPVVCTEGDELAERIDRLELGAIVPPSDPAALADAIERVLERGRESYSDALGRAAESYTWSRIAEPLVRFVTAEGAAHSLGEGRPLPAGPRVRGGAYRALQRVANAVPSRGRRRSRDG